MINGNYKNLTIYLLFFQVSIFDYIEDIEQPAKNDFENQMSKLEVYIQIFLVLIRKIMDLKNYFKTASTNYIYTRPCELNWILVTHGWMQITANLVWSVLPPTLFPPFGYLILTSFKNQNTHEKRGLLF